MKEADEALEILADYILNYKVESQEAFDTAVLCLGDALGCAILSLKFPECSKLLGPIVPGTIVPKGFRVPGTSFVLDPVQGAFNLGAMIRWLDFNDTFLAAEWAHPSDNLGGLLALSDFLTQNGKPISMLRLLEAQIKAYEIQGGIALKNSFNRIGFDHVILVKIATAGLASYLLGGQKKEILSSLSNAFIDTGSLRTYRHEPNTGSRKSWAAGDATKRGVELALIAQKGEMGYPQALTAKKWGFYDVLFNGKPLIFDQPLNTYVMENILFKISFPAEFHAQTAVEAALQLHPQIKGRLKDIEAIDIITHEAATRIIDKKGPLKNPADRDHCLQYMVAIALIHGNLTAEHYENEAAAHPLVDVLREKMHVKEHKTFSEDYLHPGKRSIANSLQIAFKDGTKSSLITIEFPLGHKKRRFEALPLLYEKMESNLQTKFNQERVGKILNILKNFKELQRLTVSQFIDLFRIAR